MPSKYIKLKLNPLCYSTATKSSPPGRFIIPSWVLVITFFGARAVITVTVRLLLLIVLLIASILLIISAVLSVVEVTVYAVNVNRVS